MFSWYSFPITEAKCSSLARSEAETQKDTIMDESISVKTEAAGNHQPGPVSNGVAKSGVVVATPNYSSQQMVTATVATAPTPSNDHPKIPPLPENGDGRPKD